MSESIILALDNGLLQKLTEADTALKKLGESSDEITKKIISNFKEASEKGVAAFTQDVKDKIKNLNIDPIKVGLSLDPKAIDDLKKQIAGLGVTVPVGANVTGASAGGNIPNLQAVLDSIVKLSNNLMQSIKDFPFGKSVEASAYTSNQIETLNKRARTALYRGELNALTELSNKEKERQRKLREQDKENQLRHRDRLNQIKIEEARNKLKINAEIDELKRLAKAYKQMPTSIDSKQVGKLVNQSKKSQTVNQRITAVNNLKNALKDLDTTDRSYQRTVSYLNKEIRRQESELRKLGHQMNKVKEHSHNLFNISGQLGRALSLMFSVSQITQYISKMVNIRKEMELQQRSLQVLLQNKDKANELWNQTLDLAVKSPFRVKELVTYTKQLAAYRIESDKLFETNKMLADVSAGLGVDMQRLILAFGQVRSASFLRGTELRQFTEAGIPMLEELAKYLGEIYGRSISVAEVFDMISKRMITFSDVEKVFQRMTSAGGVFFNMQEELSQTTAGMISNLQDSIDLMFNEMGKKNQGIINGVIKAARNLVNNWEAIGVVMKSALVTLLLYKAATMNISNILANIAAKWGNIKSLVSLIKGNPLEFLKTFKGNAIMVALTAIASLIIKIVAEHRRYKQALREVEEEHEKFRNSISKVENDFADVFKNGSDNIEDYKGKLQELIGIAQQSYNIELDFEVNKLSTIDEVSRKFDELKEKILSFDNLSLQFSLDFVERDDRGWGWFQDYLGEDLKDLSTSQKDIKTLASSIRGLISGTIKDVAELDRLNDKAESLSLEYSKLKQSEDIEGAKKIKEEIDGITGQIDVLESKLKGVNKDIVRSLFPQGVDETEYEYIQRITNAISKLNEEAKKFGLFNVVGVDMSDIYDFANLDISGRFEKYTTDLKEAEDELLEFYRSSHTNVANLINLSLRGQTLGFDPIDLINSIKEQNTKGEEDLEEIIYKQLTERGVSGNKKINDLLKQIIEADNDSEVNEEFKELVNILNKQSLDDEVSKYVYNSLKKIATDNEFDEAILHKMLKEAEKYFKTYKLINDEGDVILDSLDLDLIPKEEKPAPLKLKAWQEAYNQEVEEILNTLEDQADKGVFLPLKIQTDTTGISTTQDKQLAKINTAIDEAQKELERIEKQKTNLDAKLKSGAITQEQYNALYTEQIDKQKKLIEQMTHLRDLLGGDDEKEKEKGKNKNKTFKESINDDISILKSAYDKFQELNDNFSSSESFERVRDAYGKAVGEISGLTIKQTAAISNATETLAGSIDSYDNALVEFTKAHESFREKAYDLGDGVITIGYGSTDDMFPDEGIVMGATIDEEKAKELLRITLEKRNNNLKEVIEEKSQELGTVINQSMYNALIDMGYQGSGSEDFYSTFFNRVLDVDEGVEYISEIAKKIGEVFGEDFEHPFTETFIETFRKVDIGQRIAMMLEASNLTVNGGQISKTLFKGMLKRSQDRRDLAMGSLEYDFTTLEGLKKALESLKPKAASAGEQAMNALLKAISDVDVEIGVRARIKENEKISKEISDMFSGYEIGLELKDLNMPSNIVKDVFSEFFGNLDIDVSLDDILEKIQQFKNDLDKADIDISSQLNSESLTDESNKILQSELEGNRKRREQLTKDEQKVTEMLNKQYLERLKTYLAYARKSIGERARLKLEEYNKLAEIDKTFEVDDPNRTAAETAVSKETTQKLDKIEWEEFQKTDTFINLFRDLENASETMLKSTLKKLNEFKSQWSDMPLEDMKQVIDKINELEKALANLNPSETISTSRKNLDNYISDENITGGYSGAISNLQQESFNLEMENMKLDKTISNLEAYNRLVDEGKNEQAESFKTKYLEEQDDLSKDQIKNLKNQVQNNKVLISGYKTLLDDAKKLQNAYLKQSENIGKVEDIVSKLKGGFDSVVEAASALGKDTENIELFGNMAFDIISSTLGMVQLQLQLNAAQVAATGFGAAMNAAMGVIGWIVLAVQAIFKIITAIAKSSDNQLVKQIEKQQREIERLEKEYENLSEKIDEAWNTQQLREYHRELVSTTEDLIIAQKAAIAAQESRKGANNEDSEEWKELQEMYEKLEEYQKQLEDSEKEIFSKITGGIIDDVLSAAEDFVDAWYDAFKETGDGLKGLEENFNEMLLNLVKRQAAMNIAGKFIDQWNAALERYADDGSLSFGEITSWANMIEQDLPALSSQLETFFNAFNGVLGDTQGNLSGLQRGIQGITEQQADILASYLNSIRFIVSDSNYQLKALVAQSTEYEKRTDNPMISQLRIIAQQTTAINTLLNSLTAPHPTLSGRGLKVVI